MADNQFVKFVSNTELNAKKENKRRAREQLLQEAKAEYEREERRREKRKAAGEDTWILPGVSDRIADDDDEHRKKKKRKKEKKNKEKTSKKHKKKSKKERDTSSDSDSDEWVEKDAKDTDNSEDKDEPDKKEMPVQRDGWMMFPCFSGSAKPAAQQREQDKIDEVEMEDNKKVSVIDMTGQHDRELNPYWKSGGKGLPITQQDDANSEKPFDDTTMYDAKWLKKALQRSKQQAEEEGCSLEDVVSQRWGSLERLEKLITEAEKGDPERRYTKETGDRGRSFEQDKGRSWNRNSDRERYQRDDRHRGRDRDRDRYHDDEQRNRDYPSRDKYNPYDRENKKDFDTKDTNISNHGQRSDKDTLPGSKSSEERDNRGPRRLEKGPDRSSATGVFKRPDNSKRFMKPSDASSSASTIPSSKPASQSSGGWRKKSAEPKINRIEQALKKRKENSQESDQSSSSDSSDSDMENTNSSGNKEVEEDSKSSEKPETEPQRTEGEEDSKSSEKPKTEPQHTIPVKKVTEADLNSMGAKILRAELMGNEDLAAELKVTLEQMRKDKEAQEASTSTNEEPRKEEIVVLTRTDKFGNTRPVSLTEAQEPKRGRRKREKVTTHDNSGQRERYFADDDRYQLNEIVRREKMNSAEDYNSMFARLASKGASKTDSDDFTLDDHFVSGAANKYSKAKEEEREKMRAIKEHQRLSAQLSKCRFCFENPDLSKHLIIAIGIQVYLAVPLHTSLTEGHCLIIPMQHQLASTYLDEDVVDEVKVFKKGLTRMFQEMNKDVVFLETCRNLTRQNHMIIECIPVPKEEGDLAPMYFKKAILESDSEWAHNKKLIDTSKKGLRGSIPKGLPYFSVEFGLDGGFAHVVEEEHLFPHYFGKEIIGGMLDLEPWTWHKPHKENFEQHKKKVLQLADWWKPYDWTKKLNKTK